MKFTNAALPVAFVLVASVASIPLRRRDVNAALIPEFGHQAGLNPTGTGDCDGVNGVKVPCACPPPRGQFIASLNANVGAGHAVNNPGIAVSFPEDPSKDSAIKRMQTALVTLQNLNGPGKGCPAAATTFVAQLAALQNGGAAPAPAPPPPPPAPAPAPAPPAGGKPSAADVARLAPDMGFTSGRNPTGTGDCDGAVNGPDGKPIKVPCACPPPKDQFVAALQTNVAAGVAVNNPGIQAPFPLDDSNASKRARISTGLITLQNLNGPGKGCPASSTTLLAQLNAIPA